MHRIRVIHDSVGHTLTVWWGEPNQEHVSTMADDEVIVMKDRSGRVIGFEALHYHSEGSGTGFTVETSIQPAVPAG